MTEVKFFFNVESRLHYACKIAKRAYDEGRRLTIYAPQPALEAEIDRLLWTFAQLSFVPHVRAGHPLATETPVIITGSEAGLMHHDALLNLADEAPPFFSRFESLREVVSNDPQDKAHARERAKFYKSRGFDVTHIDAGAPA